jgi:rubrerythrin
MNITKSTKEWWDKVSNSPEEMTNWLKNQYHGEVTAEARIRDSIKVFGLKGLKAKIINSIADDEAKHASWVADLLVARGIQPKVLVKKERYWDSVLPKDLKVVSFKYFAAVGHLAETMRLERIQLLASDPRFEDIAKVMSKIYPDELFHARAFKELSSKKQITQARKYHNIGMNSIGLLP